MSAMGSMQQSQAASSAANYQAQVARNNQTVADWKAKDALARGQVSEDQRRMKTSLQIAAQRAAMAGNGSDVNTGSAIDIVGDGRRPSQEVRPDAEQRRVVRPRRALGRELRVGVGANLLAGASTVADKWSVYKQKGIL